MPHVGRPGVRHNQPPSCQSLWGEISPAPGPLAMQALRGPAGVQLQQAPKSGLPSLELLAGYFQGSAPLWAHEGRVESALGTQRFLALRDGPHTKGHGGQAGSWAYGLYRPAWRGCWVGRGPKPSERQLQAREASLSLCR